MSVTPTASDAARASLVPFSGVQFFRWRMPRELLAHQPSYRSKTLFDDVDTLRLFPLTRHPEGDLYFDSEGEVLLEPSEAIHVNLREALQIFADQWLPLPVLRRDLEADTVAKGPTDWARFCCTEIADDPAHSHWVTVALDTQLLPHHPKRPYAAPSPEDAAGGARFALAKRLIDMECLYDQDWGREMIEQRFEQHLKQSLGEALLADFKAQLPTLHIWAHYVSLVDWLARSEQLPELLLTPPASTEQPAVAVDLVLHLGPEQCAAQWHPSDVHRASDLSRQSTPLRLQRFDRPSPDDSGVFSPHLAFHQADFGNTRLSRRRRGDAFQWASPARLGAEAEVRLERHGAERACGRHWALSRDHERQSASREWCFYQPDDGEPTPALQGIFFRGLNNQGQGSDSGGPSGVTRALYSPSALPVFLWAELLTQAVHHINAWDARAEQPEPHRPRRLRSIHVHLDPLLEDKRAIRQQAEWARQNLQACFGAHLKDTEWQWLGSEQPLLLNRQLDQLSQRSRLSRREALAVHGAEGAYSALEFQLSEHQCQLWWRSARLNAEEAWQLDSQLLWQGPEGRQSILALVVQRHILPECRRWWAHMGVDLCAAPALNALLGLDQHPTGPLARPLLWPWAQALLAHYAEFRPEHPQADTLLDLRQALSPTQRQQSLEALKTLSDQAGPHWFEHPVRLDLNALHHSLLHYWQQALCSLPQLPSAARLLLCANASRQPALWQCLQTQLPEAQALSTKPTSRAPAQHWAASSAAYAQRGTGLLEDGTLVARTANTRGWDIGCLSATHLLAEAHCLWRAVDPASERAEAVELILDGPTTLGIRPSDQTDLPARAIAHLRPRADAPRPLTLQLQWDRTQASGFRIRQVSDSQARPLASHSVRLEAIATPAPTHWPLISDAYAEF